LLAPEVETSALHQQAEREISSTIERRMDSWLVKCGKHGIRSVVIMAHFKTTAVIAKLPEKHQDWPLPDLMRTRKSSSWGWEYFSIYG
jgi:hypothetical protein